MLILSVSYILGAGVDNLGTWHIHTNVHRGYQEAGKFGQDVIWSSHTIEYHTSLIQHNTSRPQRGPHRQADMQQSKH